MIIKGSLLGILNVLKKVYIVSFKIKPTNFTMGLKSVLHLTLGNNNKTYGDRNPGVWFHEDGSGKLVIFAAVNGNASFYIETSPLRLDEWSDITISQSYLGSKYWFSVSLNGVTIYRTENSDAREFKHIKVYASDIWYDAQNDYITGLLVINGNAEQIIGETRLEKGKIVAEIPKLNEEYLISFDLYPKEFSSDWRNVLHFTIGSNEGNFGDRTPGIWFEPGDYNNNIHISAPINGNPNKYISLPILNRIKLNQWSNIKVAQIFVNKSYNFIIIINGEAVHTMINEKYQSFGNVKVYASDPWFEAQDGLIKNFFIINGISSNSKNPIIVLPSDSIFSRTEFIITPGLLIGTLNTLKKVYIVSFKIKPITFTKGLKSVFHLTLGNDKEVYGDRNPGVWFHEDGSGKLVIFSAVNGDAKFYIETPPLRLSEWSYITISQSYLDSRYWFSVYLNGVNINRTENSDARDFKNMKVYASDIWYDAQNGYITGLLVINGNAEQIIGDIETPLEKGKIVAEIPKLMKEYLISFDLYPNQFSTDWRNLLHFTIGFNYGNYGDRTPGIWFEPGYTNKNIHISAPIDGNPNKYISIPILNRIQLNQWSNIKVAQIFENNNYNFTVIINGEVVHTIINKKYQCFDNVKVYASDPWYEAQEGFVKNFFIINGISNSINKPIIILPSDYVFIDTKFTITSGSLFGTLNILKKVYTVSFKIKPTNYTKGLKSVLHLTLGNNNEFYGDRNPGVWFHEDGSGKLVIFAAVNGNPIFYIETPPLRLGEWSYITISQNYLDSKYWFSVFLNGVNINRTENYDAREFKNVKVYASDNWYDAQKGYITDLLVFNRNAEEIVGDVKTPLEKGKIIAEIPKLHEEYLISFDFYPNEFSSDWRNVLHFTIGSDYQNYGDRTPGIWFEPGYTDKNIHFSAPINGNPNNIFTTPILNIIKKNQWSNIEVAQILKNNNYTFTININGDIVFTKINNKYQSFDNVKVYASDPWYEAQDGFIKNLYIFNGISNSNMPPIIVLPSDYIIIRKEFAIKKDLFLGTLNFIDKEYTVSFNVKPKNFAHGQTNVLHFTFSEYSIVYDFRSLSVWFHEDGSGKLVIYPAFYSNDSIETTPLKLGEWSSVKICQNRIKNKYWLSVELNGAKIYRAENELAIKLKYIKVYASDPLHNASNASISDILIVNRKVDYIIDNVSTKLVKGKIVAEITKLNQEYIISFYTSSNNCKFHNCSVINFVDVFDTSNYGEITPSVLFNNDETLQFTIPDNGCRRNVFNTDPIKLNQWQNIEISQILKFNLSSSSQYVYTIKINEKIVYSGINYKPKYFDNVKVYASDPVHKTYDGLIKNLVVINGISNVVKSVYDSEEESVLILPSDYIIQSEEFTLFQGLLLATLNVLQEEFTVSFNIKPTNNTNCLKSVLSLFVDGYTDNRFLDVFFHKNNSGKLVIKATINNKIKKYETAPLILNTWSSIKIKQSYVNNGYLFSGDLNGFIMFKEINNSPKVFTNIKVYASNPLHDALNGSISDIIIVNGKAEYIVGNTLTPLVKGNVIASIPKLEMQYIISFDINPSKFDPGLHNVISFKTDSGNDIVFCIKDDGSLQIDAPLIQQQTFNTDPIGLNIWSNIVISQISKNNIYLFIIRINGLDVYYKVNNQPKILDNVKVYASHPWYELQEGLIKNFLVVNGISKKISPSSIFGFQYPVDEQFVDSNYITSIKLYNADYIKRTEKFTITKGLFFGTLNSLMKVFTVSFSVMPTKYSKGLKSVLHLILDDNYGDLNKSLGVWFHQDGSGKLVISAAVSNNATYYIETTPLMLGQWASVKICQSFFESNYWLSIDLNGILIHIVNNSDVRDFKNIKVYASSLQDDAQNGSISDLLIINRKTENLVGSILTPLVKGKVVAEIPNLDKEYLISFDFIPYEFVFGFHSVICLTLSSTSCDFGIFLHKVDDEKIHIVDSINCSNQVNVTKQLQLNIFANIVVDQILENGIYIYKISINGEDVFSKINKQPQSYNNVFVYASDPNLEVQNGSIKNFFIINGNSNSSMQPVVILSPDYINQRKEYNIVQGLLLGTLKVLMKVFTLSFKIRPTTYTDGLKSVLCLILDDDYGTYGDKCPGIWFYQNDSGILTIFAALSFNNIYLIKTGPLGLNEWSTVKVYQTLSDGMYRFNIELNGTMIYYKENAEAKDFKNIKVYASDPWHNAQYGSITDLLIINGKSEYIVSDVEVSLPLIIYFAEIPKLDKEYLISFDIYPHKFDYKWRCYILFIIELDDRDATVFSFYGDGDGKLKINTQVNGIIIETKTNLITLTMWSNIEVSQILVSRSYIHTVRINGQVIFSIPNDLPQSFDNVIVYAFDPWSNPAQFALIKNLFVVNGIAKSSLQPVVFLPKDYINQRNELTINRNSFLGTLKVLMKVFTLSFKIKPTRYSDGINSVLCLILNDIYGNYCNNSLGVWFHQNGSGVITIFAALSFSSVYSVVTAPLELNKWSTIKVYQTLFDGKYRFNVEFNGNNIYFKENVDARDFNNIKVYASDPWHNAQYGLIADLLIINGKSEYIVNKTGISLLNERIVAKIPLLEKEYLISFDIYLDSDSILDSIIRFTNDVDNVFNIRLNHGMLEIHTLFHEFFQNSISYSINFMWSNIEISQILKGKRYIFTVRINGDDRFFFQNKLPQHFYNVKVFVLESSLLKLQNASIKNLFIVNGISNSSVQPVLLDAVFPSNVSGKKNTSSIIAAILVPVLVLLVVVVVVVLRIRKNKSKYQQSKWKSNEYTLQDFKGFHNLDSDAWEIPPEYIIVDKKIGEGAFGTVFIGKISEKFFVQTKSTNQKSKITLFNIKENVAVKFLKDNANQSEFDDFRDEINLMKEIGYHKNIVNMIGCSTIEKPLCLVVEFMENGDLLHYLRNKRNKLSFSKVDGESYSTFMYTQDYQQTFEASKGGDSTYGLLPNDVPLDNIGVITPDDLLSFSWQVASGMEYLSFAKLVHRDLAARNILVGAEKTVKISDFGLTRKTNDELNYMSNTNRRLPVKWMSVEAIFDQKFTTYSDVWAYGVVLFEIVTLGGTPYPSMSNHDLVKLLKSGYRMERPENCSQPLYDLMLRCWNEDPLQRPSFTELREHFDQIMSEGDNYCNLDVDEKNTYYNIASFQSVVSETCVDSLDVEILPMSPQLKPLEKESDELFSRQLALSANDEFNVEDV